MDSCQGKLGRCKRNPQQAQKSEFLVSEVGPAALSYHCYCMFTKKRSFYRFMSLDFLIPANEGTCIATLWARIKGSRQPSKSNHRSVNIAILHCTFWGQKGLQPLPKHISPLTPSSLCKVCHPSKSLPGASIVAREEAVSVIDPQALPPSELSTPNPAMKL